MTFGLFTAIHLSDIITDTSITTSKESVHLRLSLLNNLKLQDAIGTLTWLLVFSLSMILIDNADAAILANRPYIIACFIGYLIAFIGASRDFKRPIPWRLQQWLFAMQLLFSFAILWMLPLDFLPILTIIWSAVSLKFFNTRQAIFTTTIVVIVWFSIYGIHWEQRSAGYSALLYYSFHIFALMMSLQTKKAEQATAEAKALNLELAAARELLAESTKVQERTRIARELHDLLGHHLTALNINLQVASHILQKDQLNDEVKKAVEQSYFLAKLLMSDVREAVSAIRDNQHIDISKAIELIQTAFPHLTIHYQGEPLESDNIDLVHDVLRCTQEAITNAVKHGNAQQIWITLKTSATQDGGTNLVIDIKNDGSKPAKLTHGNGLIGMQERLNAHQGKVSVNLDNEHLLITLLAPLSGIAHAN